LLPILQKVLPTLQKFSEWAQKNPTLITAVAAAFGVLAASILLVNAAMALNPVVIIVAGITALIVSLVMAYKKFEGFRNVVNSVINNVASNFELLANAFIKTINLLIKGINLVKPGENISPLSEVKFGRIGDNGGGGNTGSIAAFEQGQQTIVNANPNVFSAPPAVAPSAPGKVQNATAPAFDKTDGNAGGFGTAGIGGIGPFDNITINLDAGLISSPATVGQDIIDAILAAQRDSGVVFAPAVTL
jgi:hypothetical protein